MTGIPLGDVKFRIYKTDAVYTTELAAPTGGGDQLHATGGHKEGQMLWVNGEWELKHGYMVVLNSALSLEDDQVYVDEVKKSNETYSVMVCNKTTAESLAAASGGTRPLQWEPPRAQLGGDQAS
jgi:hypothetical protein